MKTTAVSLQIIVMVPFFFTGVVDSAQGAIHVIDPGEVDQSAVNPIFSTSFTVPLNDPIFDVRFSDMKTVAATYWRFNITNGPTAFVSERGRITFSSFLSRQDGTPIPRTVYGHGFLTPPHNYPPGSHIFSSAINPALPLTASGFHLNLSELSYIPVGSEVELEMIVDGTVGEVPEPPSAVLWGLFGMASLMVGRRARRSGGAA